MACKGEPTIERDPEIHPVNDELINVTRMIDTLPKALAFDLDHDTAL